jgi:hypothetical protein
VVSSSTGQHHFFLQHLWLPARGNSYFVWAICYPSIIQSLSSLSQLPVTPFRVPCRRIQILVTENLRQPHQIVPVIGEKLVCHRVPEKVGVELHAD